MRPKLFTFIAWISGALCVASAAFWAWTHDHAQSLRWVARLNVVLHLPFPSGPNMATNYRRGFPDTDRAYEVEDRLAVEWAYGHVWLVAEREWRGARPWRPEPRPAGRR